MSSANFRKIGRSLIKAELDFDTLSAKVLLVSSVPSEADLDNWINRSDVTSEITGAGYTAGGIPQAFTLDAFDDLNNRQPITYLDNPTAWTAATITAVGGIIYKTTGLATTDTLLHWVDFGGTISVSPGTFGLEYLTKFYVNT